MTMATEAAPARAATTFAIEADGLVKDYPKGVRALDGLSFAVRPGQVTGFIGPNGPRIGRPFPAGLSPAGMACRGEVLPRS